MMSSVHHPPTPPVRPRAGRRRSGFSLLEILLVLGLMALLAGLVIANSDALLAGVGEKPLPEILKRAVREARFQAAFQKQVVYLTFDVKTSAFRLYGADGQDFGQFPTGYEPESRDLEVRFFHLLPGNGRAIFNSRVERQATDAVGFGTDRSSEPFEVELEYDGTESKHRYDPFSDAEIKPPGHS